MRAARPKRLVRKAENRKRWPFDRRKVPVGNVHGILGKMGKRGTIASRVMQNSDRSAQRIRAPIMNRLGAGEHAAWKNGKRARPCGWADILRGR